MAETWRKCNACKNPIPFHAKYWACSVSTCNRPRTGYVFCTVSCWDSHIAEARHRDAWADEKRAPSKEAWDKELAANPEPAALHTERPHVAIEQRRFLRRLHRRFDVVALVETRLHRFLDEETFGDVVVEEGLLASGLVVLRAHLRRQVVVHRIQLRGRDGLAIHERGSLRRRGGSRRRLLRSNGTGDEECCECINRLH